jgi:toxin ParE1/3/4
MKKFKAMLTEDAAKDLEDIHGFISRNDSLAAADKVLESFIKAFAHLETHPNRGNYPREFLNLGIKDYRESFFKPYRIVFRVMEETVFIYLIADGRRDMQTLLTRRLLRGD